MLSTTKIRSTLVPLISPPEESGKNTCWFPVEQLNKRRVFSKLVSQLNTERVLVIGFFPQRKTCILNFLFRFSVGEHLFLKVNLQYIRTMHYTIILEWSLNTVFIYSYLRFQTFCCTVRVSPLFTSYTSRQRA